MGYWVSTQYPKPTYAIHLYLPLVSNKDVFFRVSCFLYMVLKPWNPKPKLPPPHFLLISPRIQSLHRPQQELQRSLEPPTGTPKPCKPPTGTPKLCRGSRAPPRELSKPYRPQQGHRTPARAQEIYNRAVEALARLQSSPAKPRSLYKTSLVIFDPFTAKRTDLSIWSRYFRLSIISLVLIWVVHTPIW